LSGIHPDETNSPNHHGSHRHLLTVENADEVRKVAVDAVVVPAARPVGWLGHAIDLTVQLGCVLVAMCSKDVMADEVLRLGKRVDARILAVDIAAIRNSFPAPSTDRLLSGTPFHRRSDASRKRNFALVLSHLAGWDRLLFLDDDIFNVEPSHAQAACGLLDYYDAVGLQNLGYPDNSVVCHAYRDLGGVQDQFVGVGALALRPRRICSFFPNVYNQDWLFLLGAGQSPRVAVTGLMKQKEYDPFAHPNRARSEEFGDCLAEGLYWLLDNGQTPDQADERHWRNFLDHRRTFISHLLKKVAQRPDTAEQRKWQESLRASEATCALIDPRLCTKYVSLWRSDLEKWRASIALMPDRLGLEKALAHLGWPALLSNAPQAERRSSTISEWKAPLAASFEPEWCVGSTFDITTAPIDDSLQLS